MSTASANSLLTRIVAAVTAPHETMGVLLHGSYGSRKPTPDSDIDLICVLRNETRQRYIRSIEGFSVDLFAASHSEVNRIIHCDLVNNNNLVLYAFERGRPLIDPDGVIAELTDTAKRIWTAGPASPSAEEKQRIETSCRLAHAIAHRTPTRARRSQEWTEMANLHSATLFFDCLYAYCRIHRLWSCAIWEMLQWTDVRYAFLQEQIRTSLKHPSLDARADAIRQIAEATVLKCSGKPCLD